MPVYNSERFLEDAVESVLNQTFKDFELILIDDGSSDGSVAICDRFAQKDDRVVVIHQSNTGICGARNKGLQLARGEYIAFSDHDDKLVPNLLEDNINLAVKYDADVVKFGYQVDEIYSELKSLDYSCAKIHGGMEQGHRLAS
jgi:glycosyltransferase involved in cell wall biosynthesis